MAHQPFPIAWTEFLLFVPYMTVLGQGINLGERKVFPEKDIIQTLRVIPANIVQLC